MKYKNVKVEQVSISIYIGEEYSTNDFKLNQNIFKKKIKGLSFKYGFGYECPIEDMICVYPDSMGNLEPMITKLDTNKILVLSREFEKEFGENVKINFLLDDFIEGIGNSVDLDVSEFIQYLNKEN